MKVSFSYEEASTPFPITVSLPNGEMIKENDAKQQNQKRTIIHQNTPTQLHPPPPLTHPTLQHFVIILNKYLHNPITYIT